MKRQVLSFKLKKQTSKNVADITFKDIFSKGEEIINGKLHFLCSAKNIIYV